jgi:hypothetical protein
MCWHAPLLIPHGKDGARLCREATPPVQPRGNRNSQVPRSLRLQTDRRWLGNVKTCGVHGFISNLVANLAGTFVGVGLALLGTWWLERKYVASRERSQLQGLVDRLYRSRAIAPGRSRPRGGALSPAEETDRERCAQSVIATRDRIAAISERLTVYLDVVPVLDRMYVACLHYLERAEEPTRYVDALMTLRADLVTHLDEVKALVPGLVMRDPGTAYPYAQTGTTQADEV